MKIRTGFVSNSSSSSFAIPISKLTFPQAMAIKYHAEYSDTAKNDSWTIEEDRGYIVGSTWMDNFPMYKFLEEIGVDEKHIKWDSDNEY